MTRDEAPPDWLETRAILALFGQTEAQAIGSYRNFVAAGTGEPSPWKNLKRQVFLGTDAFVGSMQSRVSSRLDLREMPQARCRAVPRSLQYYDQAHADRNRAIKAAYASGGIMQEIGDYFGLHLSRVSRIVRAQSGHRDATGAKVKT
jgi:REP-associated tyrosine transposase